MRFLRREDIFVFSPDNSAIPGFPDSGSETSGNQKICPIQMTYLKNCKCEYKFIAYSDCGNVIDTIVVKEQYSNIEPISNIPAPIQSFFQYPGFTEILQIDAKNISAMSRYIDFEEKMYLYREVKSCYLNLFCDAEKSGLICASLLGEFFIQSVLANLGLVSPQEKSGAIQSLYNFRNVLVKSRIVALKQLCKC